MIICVASYLQAKDLDLKVSTKKLNSIKPETSNGFFFVRQPNNYPYVFLSKNPDLKRNTTVTVIQK